MLCEAASFYPEKKKAYIKIAESIGDVIWSEGLLLKGNGLCHGIAGNAYMLHTLHRVFIRFYKESKDDEEQQNLMLRSIYWRDRCLEFVKAMYDEKIQEACSEHNNFGARMTQGVPDYPWSLMEGLSGEICLLSDLLTNENKVRFPGFEI